MNEYAARLDSLRAALQGVALYVSARVNIRYLTGFTGSAGHLLVEEDRADAVLQGSVLEIKEEPFTYGQTSAEQYRISVFVKMVFYDARQKQTLWEMDRMRGYGIYDATRQRDLARSEGIGDALQMLAKDVVDRMQVGGW